MELFICAKCGVSEGDASNLTQTALFTNLVVGCGHQFCHSCIEREFSRIKVFPCPICDKPVKRAKLSTRTLDDVQCEKDTSWRKRVLKVFNKVESDFQSLLEYNNYLEEVEDIIYSIVNEEPDAEVRKAKVKDYEEAHKAEIVKRQSQRADEERCVADRIEAEKREAEKRKREFEDGEKVILLAKRRLKQETTEVMLGEREEVSADLIAAQMQGYRNELIRQQQGKKATTLQDPRVREPEGGLVREKQIGRELYELRQAAGAGIPSGSMESQERNWQHTVSTLFSRYSRQM